MLRYLRFLAVFMIAGLALLMGANAYFDPFRIYHEPVTPVAYSHIERYRVPGLINESLYRNKDADTLLIGTSMSDNTDVTTFANQIGVAKVLKLTMAGSRPAEHILVADYALKSGNVKQIFWELHTPYFLPKILPVNDKKTLIVSPWQYFPVYLYDRNYTNDFAYLLSSDTWQNFLKIKEEFSKGKDNLSGWAVNDKGTDKAYKKWNSAENKTRIKKQIEARSDSPICEALQPSKPLEELLKFVRSYPDVKFVFFIPPLPFAGFSVQDYCTFNRTVELQRHLAKTIFAVPNAALYAYSDREDIVLFFSNYKDNMHYMPPINARYMTDMAKGKGQITPVNIDRYFAKVRDIYETGMARSDIDRLAP